MQAGKPHFYGPKPVHLAHQYRATIDVEYFSGDESGMLAAQEIAPAQRSLPDVPTRPMGIVASYLGHRSPDPAVRPRSCPCQPSPEPRNLRRCPPGQLRGQALHHADDCPLRRRVVAMKRLTALPAGGADEHNVSRCDHSVRGCDLICATGMLHQTKHAVEIDRQRRPPLLVGHALDRPHPSPATLRDSQPDIESSKMFSLSPPATAPLAEIFRSRCQWMARGLATFFCQRFGLRRGAAIAEYNLSRQRL